MSWDDQEWDAEEPVKEVVGVGEVDEVEETEEALAAATFSDEEEVVVDAGDKLASSETTKPRNPNKDDKLKPKKKSKQQEEAERQEQLAAEAEAARRAKALTPEELAAEKMRLQKMVEEADHKITEELFGTVASSAADQVVKRKDGVFDEDTCSATLQTWPLQTTEHFTILANALGKRLMIEQNQIQTKEFIKNLIRAVAPALPYEDLVDIDSVLSVIKNTKVKTKLNKKKKKVTKKFANVEGDELDGIQDKAGNNYDRYAEDYDFM